MPGLSHWQHPRFFGYFPSNAPLASVLGDYVSTGLGVLGLSWQSSPALTELEEVVTDWMRQMLGLSDAWSGVIQDTASTSTLVALICARERATDYGLARGGLQAEAQPLVVYASAHSHSSVEKAALLAGFGRDNVRLVAVRRRATRCAPDALRRDDRRGPGRRPPALRHRRDDRHHDDHRARPDRPRSPRSRAQHGIWLHVDAAMAGSAMILPECRWMWDGRRGRRLAGRQPAQVAGRGVRLLALLRARPAAPGARDVHQPELPAIARADGQVKNLRDWGIPLGRRFRALKLWFLIREQGVAGLQARLRRDLANARWLAEQVAADAGLARARAGAAADASACATSRRARGRGARRHTLAWAERSTAPAPPT